MTLRLDLAQATLRRDASLAELEALEIACDGASAGMKVVEKAAEAAAAVLFRRAPL
jgi:hypothetical protein